jgi:hypothetical protein
MQRSHITVGGHYSYGLPSVFPFEPRTRVIVVDRGPFSVAQTLDDPPIPVDREIVTGWVRNRHGAYLAVRTVTGPEPGTLIITKHSSLIRTWDEEVEAQRRLDLAVAHASEARKVAQARAAALQVRLHHLGIDHVEIRTTAGGDISVRLTQDAAEHLVGLAEHRH